MKFDELKLDTAILAGVAAAGFEDCTEVQARAIPHLLEGRDVMVQSQTGTGKTAAFLLPAFQLLLHNPDYKDSTALIVAPTRELAVQIKEEADMLAENLPLTAEVFHGGVGYGQQEQALSNNVDIMVGTPGRILDLSQTGKMPLKSAKLMVIDEADRLFDMGFYPDIRKMMRRMRPREERLNMLFSATLSTRVRNIAWEYMNEPVEIEVEPEQITVDKVRQTLYHVSSDEKMSVMLGMLKARKPRSAIVFTNTKRAAEEVAKRLEINGYPSEFIIGDLPQRKRQAIIRKLKAGEAEYLVATDVAARGLHIDNLEMVINFDLPEDPEAYVHRIGRTARAGETGEAVAFACERYVFGLEAIEKLINQKIPVGELTNDLIAEDASAGMRIRTDRGAPRDGDRGRSGRGAPRRGNRRDSRDGRDNRGSREGGRAPTEKRASDHNRHDSRPSDRRRRPDNRRNDTRRNENRRNEHVPPGQAPKANDSLEERLAYYRKKYGEDFQPTDEMLASMQDQGATPDRSRKKRSRKGRSSRSSGGADRNRQNGAQRGHAGASPKNDVSNPKHDARQQRGTASGTDDGGSQNTAKGAATPGPDTTAATQKQKKTGILGKLKSFFDAN